MRIFKLHTKLLKSVVSKYVSKALSESTGKDIKVWLEDASLDIKKGRVYAHADVYASADYEDIATLVKSESLD